MVHKPSKSPNLKLWRRLKGSSAGRWLHARVLCFMAPYFGTIRPVFTVLEPGYVELTFKNRRAVRNHIGSVHAIAMCNAAELAGGTCLDASLHADFRWIPVGMTVQYLKIAKSDLKAVCQIDSYDWETPQDVVMPVGVFDTAGTEVFPRRHYDAHIAQNEAGKHSGDSMKNRKFGRMIRKINWYPPLLGMGIRVRSFEDDFTRFVVELRTRWYNRNLFGTHFGGSLYAMSDPFFVFIVTMNLGRNYIVWDKSASIDFIRPATGTITGIFEIDGERLEEIRAEVDEIGKNTYHFEVDLKDEDGQTVARVSKEVYVRVKGSRPGA